ncbi:MAG: hypothetical protein ACM3NH_04600 [Candidatus Saccharibacteria bacterium]
MKRNQWLSVCLAVAVVLLPKFVFGQGTTAPAASQATVANAAQDDAAKARLARLVKERARRLEEIRKRRAEYAKHGRFPYANPGQARLFPEIMKQQGDKAEISEITIAEIVNGAYGENAQKRLKLALAIVGFSDIGEPNPQLPEAFWQEFRQNVMSNRYARVEYSGTDLDLRMVYGIPDGKGRIDVKATSLPPEMIGFSLIGIKVNGILAQSGPYAGKLIHFVIVTAFKFPGRAELATGCGNVTGVITEPEPEPEPPPPAPLPAKPRLVPAPPPTPKLVTVVVNKIWNDPKGEPARSPKGFDRIRFEATGSDGTEHRNLQLDDSGLKLEFTATPGSTVEVVEDPDTQVKGFKDRTRKLVINIPALTDQAVIVREPYVNQKSRGCHIGALPCWALAVIGAAMVPVIYEVSKPPKKPEPPKPPDEQQKTGGPGVSPALAGLSMTVGTGAPVSGISIRF